MKNMERFIPSVCKSIVHVLQSIVDRQESDRNGVLNLTPQVQRLLKDVKSGKVTKATLEKKLKESVQSFDEGELAKVVQKGQILEADRENCFLLPLDTTEASNFSFELHRNATNRPNVVFRLLRGLMPAEESNMDNDVVDLTSD